METMIQPKVTGYRQLSEAEVALMNEGKALAEQCGGVYLQAAKLSGHSAGRPTVHQRRPIPRPTLGFHRCHGYPTRLHGGDSRNRPTLDVLKSPRRRASRPDWRII